MSNVNNMTGMFEECSVFNSDLSEWDVSNVTNMSRMFEECSVFNSDLSSWTVSNVTGMGSMFQSCSVFNSDLLLLWNVSNVTDMRRMFQECSVFNQDLSTWSFTTIPEHVNWCTGAPICDDPTKWPPQMFDITDANFYESINKYYLGTNEEKQEIISAYGIIEDWDVSQVTEMSRAFSSNPTGNIPGVPFNANISNWDVSNVTNMLGMFHDCKVF